MNPHALVSTIAFCLICKATLAQSGSRAIDATLATSVFTLSEEASQAPTRFLYQFEGVIDDALSYNPFYPVSGLDAVIGVTPVSYVFEIDFARNLSTTSNSAATWHLFYADLIGEGYMAAEIGSWSSGETQYGFNADYVDGRHVGQINGGHDVRIFSTSDNTSNWRVEDWQVGQQFRFADGTVPPNGGLAVYYLGSVTLVSRTVIPEPSIPALILLGTTLLVVARRSMCCPAPVLSARIRSRV